MDTSEFRPQLNQKVRGCTTLLSLTLRVEVEERSTRAVGGTVIDRFFFPTGGTTAHGALTDACRPHAA